MLTLGDLDELLYRGRLPDGGAGRRRRCSRSVAHPSSGLGQRASASPPLVWLGVRSYGIYLWHWPILMLTRADEDVPFGGRR